MAIRNLEKSFQEGYTKAEEIGRRLETCLQCSRTEEFLCFVSVEELNHSLKLESAVWTLADAQMEELLGQF